jgi:hypothetical protein
VNRARTIGIVAFAASISLGASPALGRPRVSLKVPVNQDAGKPVPISYTASGLRASDRLVLQRAQGTRHVWKTVVKLPRVGRSSAKLPSLVLGKYQVRIAALDIRKKLLASQQRRLRVFGKVPFSSLFGIGQGVPFQGSLSRSGTETTLTGTFSYVFQMGQTAGPSMAVDKDRNECRFVHFDIVPDRADGTVSLIQESADPVTATIPGQTLGVLEAPLAVGQSWAVNTTGDQYYFANGYGLCDSASPIVGAPTPRA